MEIRNRHAMIAGGASMIGLPLADVPGSKVSTAGVAAKTDMADVATQSAHAAIAQGALEAVKTGLAHVGETWRRTPSGEGNHVVTARPVSTEPAVTHNSRAEAKLGFLRKAAIAVADAICSISGEKEFEVLRDSETLSQTIALNRGNPAALDGYFAGTKCACEEAVRDRPAL